MTVTTTAATHAPGLASSGPTVIPRWPGASPQGEWIHDEPLPAALAAQLLRLTNDMGVSLDTVLLSAHALVLAALTGADVVVTGLTTGLGRTLPCSVATRTSSWRELLATADETRAAVLARFDLSDPQAPRGDDSRATMFETVLDFERDLGPPLPEGILLGLSLVSDADTLVVRCRYRGDAVDAAYAGRIAGYHLAAFAAMTGDRTGAPRDVSLVSEEELCYQIEGLAGPVRALPDRRVHELFEERARSHPDTVAARHGSVEWTYAQLNARANQIGRTLLHRGLNREGIVAVVTERNLDWMAAVLGVFKAGGAYLPLEPHFPPERIARVLTRAGCRLIITEQASRSTLDVALAGLGDAVTLAGIGDVAAIAVDDLGTPSPVACPDLGVDVSRDQLAYVYFTSGSTGEPKGAMCEHAGMLNHMFAKIDDLGIGPEDHVAQTAPQCFDISLWQLLAAVVVGGRTVIIGQDTILNVPLFVETLEAERITVAQLVPSYLEAVQSYLEGHSDHPLCGGWPRRALPDLRCVSATGEALKAELARRWFDVFPDITLVNAYGLTETSDDTNHQVMHAAPAGDRVPLGPAVNNVHVYVVDDHLVPVPLGAPGEIVFSGVCVGRGYVNDPERTAAAYLTDPHRPGQRLYRAGDFGRWLPGGTLDFLGRRDHQVKISGHRIEIGEIENTLLRAPGVRDGAVVVADVPGRSVLVAYYASGTALDGPTLERHLRSHLPAYMIPAHVHWRETLPLTANGKIDRKRLAVEAREQTQPQRAGDPPSTPTEIRVAGAWARVLGIPESNLSRDDHFVELGGSSLSAVKLVVALDRAVTLKDVLTHGVLADLAEHLDRLVASTPVPPN